MESLLEKNACGLIKKKRILYSYWKRSACNSNSGKKPAGFPPFPFVIAAVGKEVQSDSVAWV